MWKKSGPSAPRTTVFRGLLMASIFLLSIVAMLNMATINTVALDPHIVTGTVYEANGTVCNNCNVTVTNTRTGESSNTTSNATGVYAYNLLNLPTGWAVGDTIQVTASNSTDATGTNSTQILTGTTSTDLDVWIGTTEAVSGVNFYIIDENGGEVDGALINIKDNSGDIVVTKMSDDDGKASHSLSNGIYTVTVSMSDYDDEIQTIRVHGSDTFSFQLGEAEEGVTVSNLYFWLLILLALVGAVVIIAYGVKKI